MFTGCRRSGRRRLRFRRGRGFRLGLRFRCCLRGGLFGRLVGAVFGAFGRLADDGQLTADLDGVVFVGDDLGQHTRGG